MSPGHPIVVNGDRICFDSMLAARQALGTIPAWNDTLFEHTVRGDTFVFRCALGLSQHRNGAVQRVLNLSRLRADDPWLKSDYLDPLLAALVDAVRLPCDRTHVRESDLVGIVCLETPLSTSPREISLEAGAAEKIRQSLVDPLSVFLDGIPESRETLAARWR